MDIQAYFIFALLVSIVFWNQAKFIILPLFRISLVVLNAVLGIFLGKSTARKNRQSRHPHQRRSEPSQARRTAHQAVPKTTPVTMSNPWASETKKVSKHREIGTPQKEIVPDRAEALGDSTVIIRHDIEDSPVFKFAQQRSARERLNISRGTIRTTFMFKELLDKPKAFRD